MNFKAASAILRGGWLLDKNWADAHLPMVISVLNGTGTFAGMFDGDDTDEETEAAKAPQRVATKAGVVYKVGYYTDLSRLPEGSTAMIGLAGPLMKYGGACSYGMMEKAEMIQRAANAPNIKGIILDIDSPGGQVSGTAHLADIVKGIDKPVIAVVNDGIAASAAMWVASAADEIYLTKKLDQVGSIGVYTTLYDYNGYLEKAGVKVHEIYAPGSEDKNADYREAIKGNYGPIQEDLKVIRDEFVSTIERNRAGKIKGDEWKSGKMFYAKDAQRLGLIDGQKSFDQVVRRMDQLISEKSAKTQKNTMAFEKTLAAAKADQFEVVDGGFLVTEDNLNNIEATIAAHDTAAVQALNDQVAAAATAKETAEASLATANDTITARDARIAELEQENTTLKAGPAAGFSSTSTDQDPVVSSGKSAYHLSDENPFNRFADSVMGKPKA